MDQSTPFSPQTPPPTPPNPPRPPVVQPGAFPPPPTYVPYGNPVAPPPRIRRPSDRRDLVAAIVLVLLSVFTVNSALYGNLSLGYVIGYLSLLAGGALYLRPALTRITPFALFCFAAAVAMSGIFLWHHDGLMKTLGVPVVSVLVALALLETTGIAREDGGTLAVLKDVGRILLGRPLAWMGTAVSAIFLVKKGDVIEKRRCGGALLGLLCALPVLLVVVPLLISADAAFEGLLRHTILDNLGETVTSLILGLPLFVLIYSRLFGVRHALPPAPAPVASSRRGVNAMAMNTFLGTVGSVYVVYLFSQLAYFFSAFSGILPEGYKAAEYARRGFFEMCAICAINLGLVAITLWLSRKTEGKAPASTRWLALFILLFSLGMVATALSKMVLYIQSFGMTRLRILTGVFMLMLAALLVFVGIRLFAIRFPYMKAAVVAAAVLWLAVGYADVDTMIAHYNTTAYEEGHLEELDIDTLNELSDGAVPYLVELWDQRTEDTRLQLNNALYYRLYEYWEWDHTNDTFRFDDTPDFRSYNIDEARARALLRERAEAILACKEELDREAAYGYETIW